MNREQFIKRLKAMLILQGIADHADILYDYEEHFRAGIEAGKTEQEIAQELGDPEELAMTFAEDRRAAQAQQSPQTPPQSSSSQSYYTKSVHTQPSSAQEPQQREPKKPSRALAVFGLFWLDLCVAFPAWVTLIALCISLFAVFLAIAAVAVVFLVNTFPVKLPFMPDLARIFLGVSFGGLSVLSFTGFLGLCKAGKLAAKTYSRWHSKCTHRKTAQGGAAA